MTKTNAMRQLDKLNIKYDVHEYDASDGKIDGVAVAQKIQKPLEAVYKTIVTTNGSDKFFVFIVQVDKELDLKLAAKCVGEKSIALIKIADIEKITGYIRGGCSPIGMKKNFVTVIDSSCERAEKIIVSGGKIGVQIELKLSDLIAAVNAKIAPISFQN